MSQEKPNLHDTAALRALASGEIFLNEPNEPHEPDENDHTLAEEVHSVDASYQAQEESGGNYVPESSPMQWPAESVDPLSDITSGNGRSTNSRGGGKRTPSRQNYHVGIQFRKTVIPVLLLMAVVLFSLGIVTLVKVNNSSAELIARNPFLENGKLFAGVAIALSLCLIGGSLLFHYEVRKHHRETNGGKK